MSTQDRTPSAGQCVCIDFGTSTSKVSISTGGEGPLRDMVRPLAIGAACGADHPLLTPSVLFVDEGRILFGPSALTAARRVADASRDPILSFKTILAARDLEPTLALHVRRTVDPTGTLRHRDAFVLYLAYLNQLINIAASRDETLPAEVHRFPRRYTTPIWRAATDADQIMATLFDEAAAVSERLGGSLTEPDGVSIAQAKATLDAAAQSRGAGKFESSVFEAYAAAAAYAAFSRAPKSFALVVDMGAGTTDLTGLQQDVSAPGLEMTEIVAARRSCLLAGDEIDSILSNLLFEKLRLKQRPEKEYVWRVLKLSARTLKQELFERGKCTFVLDKWKATAKREELLKSRELKAFQNDLYKVYLAGLQPIEELASRAGADSIAILLAGGGASLPFLRQMITTAASGRTGVKAEIEQFGEQWYLPSGFDPLLQAVYPQVAISLGGALARQPTLVS